MSPPKFQRISIRMTADQLSLIANSARDAGWSINKYVVMSAIARHTDSENMSRFRALLSEQTRAIDSGFGELIDALDQRNKQAADVAAESNAAQLDAFKRGFREFADWLNSNVVTTAKGGVK